MLMFILLFGLTQIIMYKMNIMFYSIRPETINSPRKRLLKPEIKWAMGSFFHTLLYNQYHPCWPLERIQPSLFCSFLWVVIVIFILPQVIKCSVKQILKVQWGPLHRKSIYKEKYQSVSHVLQNNRCRQTSSAEKARRKERGRSHGHSRPTGTRTGYYSFSKRVFKSQ